MQIIRGTKHIPDPGPYPVMSIGNFDGAHLGHQIIFRRVAEIARENNGTGIVFTFEPHPLKIIAPDKAPLLLTSFRKKMELIEQCGIDQVICADFNQSFADQHPREFAENILVGKIGVKEMVVGYDYAFGRGREGTIAYLKKMGEEFKFKVHVIDPIEFEGHRVSSSYVRELLEEGDVVRRLFELPGVAAGQNAGAGNRTDRRRDKAVGEANTVRCQSVEIRRRQRAVRLVAAQGVRYKSLAPGSMPCM